MRLGTGGGGAATAMVILPSALDGTSGGLDEDMGDEHSHRDLFWKGNLPEEAKKNQKQGPGGVFFSFFCLYLSSPFFNYRHCFPLCMISLTIMASTNSKPAETDPTNPVTTSFFLNTWMPAMREAEAAASRATRRFDNVTGLYDSAPVAAFASLVGLALAAGWTDEKNPGARPFAKYLARGSLVGVGLSIAGGIFASATQGQYRQVARDAEKAKELFGYAETYRHLGSWNQALTGLSLFKITHPNTSTNPDGRMTPADEYKWLTDRKEIAARLGLADAVANIDGQLQDILEPAKKTRCKCARCTRCHE
jgi:hypothetical protein